MGSLRGNGGKFYFPPFPLKEPKGALPNLRYCLDFPAPQLIIFFMRKPFFKVKIQFKIVWKTMSEFLTIPSLFLLNSSTLVDAHKGRKYPHCLPNLSDFPM